MRPDEPFPTAPTHASQRAPSDASHGPSARRRHWSVNSATRVRGLRESERAMSARATKAHPLGSRLGSSAGRLPSAKPADAACFCLEVALRVQTTRCGRVRRPLLDKTMEPALCGGQRIRGDF